MYSIKPITSVKKEILIPPDKSISHRVVIFSSLCEEKTLIKSFLFSEDTLRTLDCVKRLGVEVDVRTNSVVVRGKGMYFSKKGKVILDAGESGTTMRILCGLLCAQKFMSEFRGAPSLNKRPMGRVVYPLLEMGAKILGRKRSTKANTGQEEIYPPLRILPSKHALCGGNFKLPVASAQVKSALMLASLYADKKTVIQEPYQSRDHTERMFKLFGISLEKEGKKVICRPGKKPVSPGEIFIPADFSSAAFFIVLGLILKNSELIIRNVNINPTRCGLLRVLARMNADIKLENKRESCEPYADIVVKSSILRATEVRAEEIPSLVDEIPILCVAAVFAKGRTVIRGVNELRVKETNRIDSISANLKKVGAKVLVEGTPRSPALSIKGPGVFNLKDFHFESFGDHRTAMSAIVLGSNMESVFYIDDIKCINKSFPQFIPLFESLQHAG